MSNLDDRLSRMGRASAPESAPGDDVVAADLERGQRALRRRRGMYAAAGTAGVVAVAAAASVAVLATSSGSTTHREAAGTSAVAPSQTSNAAPTSSHTSAKAAPAPTLQLVAYHGKQKAGFTVKTIPHGYVLQGVSGSTLDIAERSDHSSLNTFVGKLVVNVEQGSLSEYGHGKPVTVNGHPGLIGGSGDGTVSLTFKQGHGSGNIVEVQKWGNIHLSNDQLIKFAKGITVTAEVQRSHG